MQRAAKWKIPLLVIFGDGHRTKSINPPPNLHHQSLVGGKMTHKSAFRPLRNYFNDVTTIYDLCVLVWNQLVREALKNNPSFFRYILDSKCHFSPNIVCFKKSQKQALKDTFLKFSSPTSHALFRTYS